MNMQNATYLPPVDGKERRERHDLSTQNIFRRVVRKATDRGMVVNNGKTKLLCISDANTYRASGYIIDSDGGNWELAKK